MKTIVIGLGNPILSDDGIGVEIANQVQIALGGVPDAQVRVTEACVGGLRLMEMMIGFDRAILIDAMAPQAGNGPGKVHRMSRNDLQAISPTQHSTSIHDTSLTTALAMGEKLGIPLPQELVVYAVEVENIYDFGEELTPAVAAAIPDVTAAVLADISS